MGWKNFSKGKIFHDAQKYSPSLFAIDYSFTKKIRHEKPAPFEGKQSSECKIERSTYT